MTATHYDKHAASHWNTSNVGTTCPDSCVLVLWQMQEKFDAYANRYYILKAPRKLQWQPHLGTVEFTLTIGDAQREFCVSPLLATIILQFQVSLCSGPPAPHLMPGSGHG